MSAPLPRAPSSIVSLAIPAMTSHEAERLIDLLGQLQAALWQAHGDAILACAEQGVDGHHGSDPDDDSSF
jgi:uncharacterized protein (UPF0371 family)